MSEAREDLFGLAALLSELDRVLHPLPLEALGDFDVEPPLPPSLPPQRARGGGGDAGAPRGPAPTPRSVAATLLRGQVAQGPRVTAAPMSAPRVAPAERTEPGGHAPPRPPAVPPPVPPEREAAARERPRRDAGATPPPHRRAPAPPFTAAVQTAPQRQGALRTERLPPPAPAAVGPPTAGRRRPPARPDAAPAPRPPGARAPRPLAPTRGRTAPPSLLPAPDAARPAPTAAQPPARAAPVRGPPPPTPALPPRRPAVVPGPAPELPRAPAAEAAAGPHSAPRAAPRREVHLEVPRDSLAGRPPAPPPPPQAAEDAPADDVLADAPETAPAERAYVFVRGRRVVLSEAETLRRLERQLRRTPLLTSLRRRR